MFAPRYFARRYFARRYYAPASVTLANTLGASEPEWSWLSLDRRATLEQLISTLNQRMFYLQHHLKAGPTDAMPATDGDMTPLVASLAVLVTQNTNATTITAFEGARSGQRLIVAFGDANTTLENNTNIILASGFDYTGAPNAVREFITMDGKVFIEIP